MLKDGMGETSLRFLKKHIEPLGVFTPEDLELYKGWIRIYCHKYMPATNPIDGSPFDTASYDAFLDLVETTENI
jgi:hypothetical protein